MQWVFFLAASVLHLGNISFAPTAGGEGSTIDGQSQQLCALAAHYLQVGYSAPSPNPNPNPAPTPNPGPRRALPAGGRRRTRGCAGRAAGGHPRRGAAHAQHSGEGLRGGGGTRQGARLCLLEHAHAHTWTVRALQGHLLEPTAYCLLLTIYTIPRRSTRTSSTTSCGASTRPSAASAAPR